MTEHPAGKEKRAQLRRKKCARHGSFRLATFAGLSVVQFVTVIFTKLGKKK